MSASFSRPRGLRVPSRLSTTQLFAGPLNSEMRRRPSTDYMSLSTTGLGERPKLTHANTAGNSPMRERIGGFMGRRRDSTGTRRPLHLFAVCVAHCLVVRFVWGPCEQTSHSSRCPASSRSRPCNLRWRPRAMRSHHRAPVWEVRVALTACLATRGPFVVARQRGFSKQRGELAKWATRLQIQRLQESRKRRRNGLMCS